MESLKSLTRRVAVAEDVRGIVRTMKSLSAASIRQYEQAVESLSKYNKTLRLGFRILFHPHNNGGSNAAVFEPEPRPRSGESNRRFGAIVFGSDQGLCGRFNEAIVDYAVEHMRGVAADEDWSVMSVGNRAHMQLVERGVGRMIHRSCPGSLAGITPFVQGMLGEVQQWQQENRFEYVLVFHNKRISSSAFRPRHLRLLPPDFRSLAHPREEDGPFATLPIYRMNRTELFRALVRQYLFVALFRACAESLASENASRIASMQSAEKTISDRLTDLRSQLNERRQTAITEELLDIITGYEASQK